LVGLLATAIPGTSKGGKLLDRMRPSYVRGPERPLLEVTIDQAVRDTAGRFPGREAVVSLHQNRRLTWREFHSEAEHVARGLAGLGLQTQDRVGIWASNCIEWLLLQVACSRANLVLVNVNPAYRAHDLSYVLRKSRMRALFLRESDTRANYSEILEQTGARPEHVVYLDHPSWDEMLAHGGDVTNTPATCADVTNIQYTSGTTGSPKGVLLTHHNLVNNAWLVAGCFRLTEHDRYLLCLPLYHTAGCGATALACYLSGAVIIMGSAQFDALSVMKAIDQERVTVFGGVPTMLVAQLEHPEFSRFDFSSVRFGWCAGAPVPIELMNRVGEQMGIRELTVLYGQTETSPMITASMMGDSQELRIGTIGCAVPNTEIKIVSPSGETVPAGEQGEICTRGYLVMKGYDEDPEATAHAIDPEGWLRTGDLGVMRPDGYFHITGRAKEMIIRGGENIFPREIEDFLITHPKISDVQVVGLPDAKLGEAVLAWIRLKPGESATEAEIGEFCLGQIAHFKIPQFIRFVTEFPMTVSGKVQKFMIRQIEIRERGLEEIAQVLTA
jgi:fatty-acyl-CoA synthase